MPVLLNSRHELFAQATAEGKSLEEAHALAGYSGNRKSAWPLSQRPEIISRIAELLERKAQIETEATQMAVEATGLTKAWVIQQAKDVLAEARTSKEHTPALKAIELLGREVSAFIEKKEIRTGPLEGVDPDELDRIRAEIIAERARRLGGGGYSTGKEKPN